MKRYCKYCGKKFEQTPRKRLLCSPECTSKYADLLVRGKVFTQYCSECGKPIKNYVEQRFCSTECRQQAIARDRDQAILDGEFKVDHLSNTIAYCHKVGITYAQYQIQQTIALRDSGKLGKRGHNVQDTDSQT